jgi:hypothetical protein
MQTAEEVNKATEDTPFPQCGGGQLSTQCLLAIMRGFSWVLWGLPLTLLLFFNALQVQVLAQLRLPSYVVGVVILFVGLTRIARSGSVTPSWQRWARAGVLLSFIMAYLAPFVYWWQHAPHIRFFGINMWLLLACTMLVLVVVNRLASEVGKACYDTTFATEARLSAWSVVVLMMFPFGIAVGYAYYTLYKYGVSVQATLGIAHREMPFWLHVFFLLPFTLTMTMAWKARERSVKGLADAANRRGQL